ncbi:glycoside hydrolase family 3 C-terminal domain-containing protein [Mucilaginibacter jinjuensis]|uniref:Glycoside hydrolase family 3 C-terminal domain-containing protein n=1 Tax=Mucilaginibacter jinjuensis TaxID=1176721 RepID=A0ABY7T8J8_9SPHI|nr:glycoside hydrolase family 3 C-terminal domain-containing protein [Mucilaginibacter jinjuensis]WCT12589.1 glycoside hydrolase family 3 C-terminal domain-containing protein [Mucilaginibacter jinjuensis]
MKPFKILCLALLVPSILSAQKNPATKLPQLGKAPLKSVVAAMTLEEKVKLIVGMGFNIEGIPPGMLPPVDPADNVAEKVVGAAGRSHAVSRLGIPTLTLSDGPAGVRINPIRHKDSTKTYYATAFPVGTLLASSWDTALVKRVGVAFGREVLEYGIDILLAPGMNIQRNPLGGRNFEYYSEEPIIAGNMAASFVKGIQSNGVGTSIKHFAANNAEFNRMNLNTYVSERALREIYLRGFEIAVKTAQPWTVMSSYNYINSTYTSESKDLLTTILRNEWGFKGYVMTDWFGGKNAVAQVNAGNDQLMPGTTIQTKEVLEGVKSGKISMEQLDKNVTHILNIILKSPTFKGYKYSDKPDLKADARVSRMAATEGMVLLKNNDNTLPLTGTKSIALFGNTSYDLIAGGTGSGDVNKAYVISVDKGFANAGYKVDATLSSTYKAYITDQKAKRPKPKMMFLAPEPIGEMPLSADLLKAQANKSDIGVITIGRLAGEGGDRKEADDFNLTAVEQTMINDVTKAFHDNGKKVVVILNIGGPVETASWRDKVDGILLAWDPGLEGGNAIADVLSGKVNPSGKLTATFPMAYADVPNAKDFPGKELPGQKSTNPLMGNPAEVTYDDGIYVGYRYFNTFDVKPAYEFGYGLSYTKFDYSKLKLSSDNFKGKITASVLITNQGKVAGKEVVQLYLSAPHKNLNKPESELKGFVKTRLLKPGEAQLVSFVLDARSLASFNTATETWVAEKGDYKVKIGASSLDIKKSEKFSLANDLNVLKVHKALAPASEIKELTK